MIVGLGPGSAGAMTPDAASAIDRAEVIVGYRGYLDLIADRIAAKEIVGRELGQEVERAELALTLAQSGRVVALVSSGDAGVYAMGGVALELAASRRSDVQIEVIPGVTAALSASALLGAPLAHDWACISLSDLLTPWDVIVSRVDAAARADFALAFYNPKSQTRTRQLPAVVEILLRHRSPKTPVGLVENAYRPGQRVEIVRLGELASAHVSMFTTVIVGSSTTIVDRGRMVTPRIYAAKSGGTTDGVVAGSSETRPLSPGESIMAESLSIIDREMGRTPSDPRERAVVRRMIHASADFSYVEDVRFHPDAIETAVHALRAGGAVLTDVEMLRAGIRSDLAGPLGVATVCGLTGSDTIALAESENLTRSAAGIRRLGERTGEGVIVAIGNAPTALVEVIRMVEAGWRPACIVGIPVGFVGVEDAKQKLLSQGLVPFITSLGRKGGTAVTAAVVNALMALAGEGGSP
ncbi:MAG: precorrin-3B C17-methyltransferase [Planctomycetota bacterium]|nr:precorrin-3B C17-methyltransferase [Planctomycetota bacterium]